MGQFALRINAEQLIHAAHQVARINGPVLDLFALGVGSADHLAALESAAGDARRRRLRHDGRARRSKALPT